MVTVIHQPGWSVSNYLITMKRKEDSLILVAALAQTCSSRCSNHHYWQIYNQINNITCSTEKKKILSDFFLCGVPKSNILLLTGESLAEHKK